MDAGDGNAEPDGNNNQNFFRLYLIYDRMIN